MKRWRLNAFLAIKTKRINSDITLVAFLFFHSTTKLNTLSHSPFKAGMFIPPLCSVEKVPPQNEVSFVVHRAGWRDTDSVVSHILLLTCYHGAGRPCRCGGQWLSQFSLHFGLIILIWSKNKSQELVKIGKSKAGNLYQTTQKSWERAEG